MHLMLLAVIAGISVVISVLLARLFWQFRVLARQLDYLARDLDRGLPPILRDAGRASRNLEEVSRRMAVQAQRVDALVAGIVGTAETVQLALGDALPVVGRIALLGAAARLARRGRRLYRRVFGR